MKEELTHKDFFYCYDENLKQHLSEHEIKYILTAYSVSTQVRFWLYQKSDELENGLSDYVKVEYN